MNDRDAALQALPQKGRYPLPPDVLQKMQAADKASIPTERFAQQAECQSFRSGNAKILVD